MSRKIGRARLFMAGSLTAALGVLALAPFNMGGCSASNLNVAGLVNATGKAFKAASLDQRHERAIGESVSLALTNQYGVVTDEQLARYVVLVGQTVASRTPRADQPWVFGVLATDDVNAFSGPGGYVWITRGAIRQMQDESELAGVLGHEIGHVVKGHGLAAAKQAGLADAAVTAVQSENDMSQFNGLSDKVADVIIKQGFSQPQEFEADQMSVQFTAAAGYDPDGFLRFLQRIRQQQKAGGSNLFSTHPGLDERIKRVADEISAAGTGGHGQTLKERFEQYTGKKPGVALGD
ncbi:MAG TPA: M48 family metalloprotease [Tepidisphaeraceae bacterium]|nr:M48 family metalloprotease [Tepidisphaeraceae bacterium]